MAALVEDVILLWVDTPFEAITVLLMAGASMTATIELHAGHADTLTKNAGAEDTIAKLDD